MLSSNSCKRASQEMVLLGFCNEFVDTRMYTGKGVVVLGLEKLLAAFVRDLVDANGKPAVARYQTLQSLEEKQIELQTLLAALAAGGPYLRRKIQADEALQSTIPTRRLKALVAYGKTTLRLLQEGVLKAHGNHLPAPDFARLSGVMPGLEVLAAQRWEEIQRCIDGEAYMAATIQMGSLLEGLLLARILEAGSVVERCKATPRGQNGAMLPPQDWKLDQLLEVSVETGWVRAASADLHDTVIKFRSLINPWEQMSAGMAVDQELGMINWRDTTRVVQDLINSVGG